MQIIFNREMAESLKERYTVLELETFDVEGQLLETFCVIPAEKINLGEMPELGHNVQLHEHYVQALKDKNYQVCRDLHEHLKGKFGGELDSFYEEIAKRIMLENQSSIEASEI